MLLTLRIKNLALVDDLTIEFQPGYNAITGETGAGKSIILGALKLILGERADRTLIRSGTDSCTIEAVFDAASLLPRLNPLLEQNGAEPLEAAELFLKRSFTATGANRQFINGSPCPLSLLSAVGDLLLDMHGPHEHQSLLNPAAQLEILDAFGGHLQLRAQLAALASRIEQLHREKADLVVDEKTYAQQIDLLTHQVKEIDAARLDPNEEEQLESEHARVQNASKLIELSQAAAALLQDEENSVDNLMGKLGRNLQDLQRLDSSCSRLAESHRQALEILHDVAAELSTYSEKISVDPERLAELDERISLLQSLKRKYGSNIAEILKFCEEAAEKLRSLQSRDVELDRINRELQKTFTEYLSAANKLSNDRRKTGPKLSKAVVKELSELGFKQSQFEVSLESTQPTTPAEARSTGMEKAEFLLSPNPGEPLRPLRTIASSGELARVMLGLKTVLSAQDRVPVLVFDEVDANVGGETATVVGQKMRRIAANRQVLCISHLAPVAAAATAHYVVTKETRNDRTISKIKLLTLSERPHELARMLGGSSKEALAHAQTLLNEFVK